MMSRRDDEQTRSRFDRSALGTRRRDISILGRPSHRNRVVLRRAQAGLRADGTARLIQPGDKVLDIGAHHGLEAMLFSKLVGERGFVLAIEPIPFNTMMAWAQVGLNGATKPD